ncbi:TPA: hypothetical protein HGR75_24960 [Escherichia coli]|nr:hypothetical protein FV300_23635 [Escherichia coli]HAG8449001.1 hypothetical protein [Escherichia coli]
MVWELLIRGKTPCKCNTDAFALLSCPTPEAGKSKFSPLPGVSAIKTGGMEVVVTRQEYGIIAAGV